MSKPGGGASSRLHFSESRGDTSLDQAEERVKSSPFDRLQEEKRVFRSLQEAFFFSIPHLTLL
jgi:hypothetical protein